VRKQAIGKKVKVVMEFKREIEVKQGPNAGMKREMEFATIFLKDKDNLSAKLLLNGFGKANLSKFAEENSKFYEDLVNAEKKASIAKAGLFSKKTANSYKFVDVSMNAKSAKTVENVLVNQGQLEGMIDFVFSGSRFKVRLDRQNVVIALCIQGIRVPQPDKNSEILTSISNQAKDYTKSIALQ